MHQPVNEVRLQRFLVEPARPFVSRSGQPRIAFRLEVWIDDDNLPPKKPAGVDYFSVVAFGTQFRSLLSQPTDGRAPGLLPMLYTPSELERELRIPARTVREWLDKGLPYQRDARGHIWIDGRRFANWVAELNHARSARRMSQAEAYCVRCRKPVRLIDPVRSCQGQKVLLRGVCPECGGSIFRGARHGQSD
jgi:hypothetical protein